MNWKKYKINQAIKVTDLFTIYERDLENGYSFGEAHDFWECVFIYTGEVLATGDNRVYTLSRHEIVFHKPMEFHNLSVNIPEGAYVYIFSFNMIGEMVPFFENKVFRLKSKQVEIIGMLFSNLRALYKKRNVQNDGKLHTNMYIEPFKDDEIIKSMIASLIQAFLLSLVDDGEIAIASEDGPNEMFFDAVKYMKVNIDKNITVDEIAKVCQTSASTLKRIFNKFMGVSVHQYYLTMKVERATELLRNGYSVCETAEKLNFSSQAHFSKVYKTLTGVNPSKKKR